MTLGSVKSGASWLKRWEAGWAALTGAVHLELCSRHQPGSLGVLPMTSPYSHLGLPHIRGLGLSSFLPGLASPREKGELPDLLQARAQTGKASLQPLSLGENKS